MSLAVSPSNPVPGVHLSVNLFAGAGFGSGPLRALLITPPETSTGDITVGTEVRTVATLDDVVTATGRSLGYFAAQAIWANHPTAQIDVVACAESGGNAATATIEFTDGPSAAESYEIEIMGRTTQVSWAVGEALTVIRGRVVTAVNLLAADLFCTAANGSNDGEVTLTARSAGPAGNDISVSATKLSGTGGTVTVTGFTGGSTEVDIATALSTVSNETYDYILPCLGNADSVLATSSSNVHDLETHITDYNSGLDARLQQGYVASTTTPAAAKAAAIARNSPYLTHVFAESLRSLPCELAGADLGDRMRRRELDPGGVQSGQNRVGTQLRGLYRAANLVTAQPSETELIDLISNGVSPCKYTPNGTLALVRSVTTYSQDSSGNPDRRAFDTADIDTIYSAYPKDLRTFLQQEYLDPNGGQVKVAPNQEGDADDLPRGVVEVREIRASIVQRTETLWIPAGAIEGNSFRAAAADGTLSVEVNPTDPTQVDIYIPVKPVPILAKLGVTVAKVS